MLWKYLALSIVALLFGAGLTLGAAAPKKKPASKAAVSTSSGRRATTKSSTSKTAASTRRYAPKSRSRQSASSRGRARGRSPQPVATRHYRGQQAPAPERCLDIQQALAERGYLQTSPSGKCDAATSEALKRMQEEQNLTPSGKITSLSLIALGLGPKRPSLGSSSLATQAATATTTTTVPE